MDSETSVDGTAAVFLPEFKKIDVTTSDAFQRSLLSFMEGKVRLVLDLSRVQFIDSSGLGKIIASLRSFRERGGEMRICGVQAPVQVLFTMVRLAEVVGIDADAGICLREFRRQADTGSAG